jgi:hypothetical protein
MSSLESCYIPVLTYFRYSHIARNSNIFTQDFSSIWLSTQGMMYPRLYLQMCSISSRGQTTMGDFLACNFGGELTIPYRKRTSTSQTITEGNLIFPIKLCHKGTLGQSSKQTSLHRFSWSNSLASRPEKSMC